MSFGSLPEAVFSTAIDLLKADGALAAILGGRVFDVPPGPRETLPYLYIGPARVSFEQGWDCGEAWRLQFRIYVAAEDHGRMAAWAALFAALRALHRAEPVPPPGWSYPRQWEAAQGGDIIDPTKLKECFADVVVVAAKT